MHACIHNTDQSENNEKDIMNQLTCVGGATFGHRPKARAQFECNDKVSSLLGKLSSQKASSFGRRPVRHRRRRREAKRGEDQGA